MDDQTQNPQQALTDKIKDTKNILVTVSNNPTVDQLSALIGLTLWLNKLDKHATAVFSGDVPSTLEFLQPADTLEKNTDSLRDFIISLDKTKADKLRYKVEDSVVKVFVTPYRTSLTADDLEFSQGDFNVDMVIALGVHKQDELDSAVTAHGRILHDATVATITIGDTSSELGAINWHDAQASSLSELVVDMVNAVSQEQIDNQIATALLTGIVAETSRFSNDKTTPQTMSISAQLMSAGANQQLVATQLDEPAQTVTPAETVAEPAAAPADGSLDIAHEEPSNEEPTVEETAEPAPTVEPPIEDAAPAEEPPLLPVSDDTTLQPAPPSWMPSQQWMSSDDTSVATDEPTPVVDESSPAPSEPTPSAPTVQEPVAEEPPVEQTPQPALDNPPATPDVDAARDEVMNAINSAPTAPEPVQALNAQPIDITPPTEQPAPAVPTTAFDPAAFQVMNDPDAATTPTPPADPNTPVDPALTTPVEQSVTLPLPSTPLTPPPADPTPPTSVEFDPTAPPPVPPPMPFH